MRAVNHCEKLLRDALKPPSLEISKIILSRLPFPPKVGPEDHRRILGGPFPPGLYCISVITA